MSKEDAWDGFLVHLLQEETKERAQRNMMFWDSRTPESRLEGQKIADPYYTNEIARPRRGRY